MTPKSPTAQSGPSDRAIAQAFREIHTMDCLHGDALMLYERAERIEAALRRIASSLPPAGARDAVTDEMAERAWRAGRAEYASRVKLSKEWDEPNRDDIESMKAALRAALPGKADDTQPTQSAATGAGD